MSSAQRSSGGNRRQRKILPDAKRAWVVFNLLHTAGYLRRFYAELLDTHDITLTQFNVLCILRGAGSDGIPTLLVAERLFDQTPGITRLLDRLEVKGLVRRQRPLNNRRQVLCYVTDKGIGLLDSLGAPMKRRAEEAVEMLNDSEVDELLRSLERIRGDSPQC